MFSTLQACSSSLEEFQMGGGGGGAVLEFMTNNQMLSKRNGLRLRSRGLQPPRFLKIVLLPENLQPSPLVMLS